MAVIPAEVLACHPSRLYLAHSHWRPVSMRHTHDASRCDIHESMTTWLSMDVIVTAPWQSSLVSEALNLAKPYSFFDDSYLVKHIFWIVHITRDNMAHCASFNGTTLNISIQICCISYNKHMFLLCIVVVLLSISGFMWLIYPYSSALLHWDCFVCSSAIETELRLYGSSLDRIIACRLVGAKPLSEPMVECC